MELNTQKTKIILFTCKTNNVHFNYYVSNVLTLQSNSMKDLGIALNSKLYFHCHVDFVYSQAVRTTHSFSSLDSLEYACVI
jgi:hypothetical protein